MRPAWWSRRGGRSCRLVGGGPEGVAEGFGVVVGGGEFDGAVAAAAAGVGLVVADADGDADDALVVVLFAGEGAVVGDGLVGGEVVQAVLDEVGPLHAGEEEGLSRGRARLCMAREDGVVVADFGDSAQELYL